MEWMERAACKGMDTNVFFPQEGSPGLSAKAVCRECGVRLECLDFALEMNVRHGVWGGANERERRRLRRARLGGAA